MVSKDAFIVPSSSSSLHPVGKSSEFDAGVNHVVADRNGGSVVTRRASFSPAFSNPCLGKGGPEENGILREEAPPEKSDAVDGVDDDGDEDDDESANDAAEGMAVVCGVILLRSLRKLLLMKDCFVLIIVARVVAIGVLAVAVVSVFPQTLLSSIRSG